jgi:hypothetical protein
MNDQRLGKNAALLADGACVRTLAAGCTRARGGGLSVVCDCVRAADDVVGRSAELSHLAALRLAIERVQPSTYRVIAPGLVDLGRDAERPHRLGERAVYLGVFRDRIKHEPTGVVRVVGDLDVEAAVGKCCRSAFGATSVGRLLELEVGDAGVWKREGLSLAPRWSVVAVTSVRTWH